MSEQRTRGSSPASEDEVQLPENAFRELRAGESYEPVVPAASRAPEVTARSIVQGVFWSAIFSAAATYIALRLGQGIESAIPISILAVGFSVLAVRVFQARASSLIENVNVLAIGATSGIIAGGSVFTMPAIFILGLERRSSFLQIFLVPLLGAVLGVFLLAPFRRYFVRELHGQLPFPEARATTEILVAGKRGGRSAIVLTYSALIAAAFDFAGPALRAWSDVFTTTAIGALSAFTRNVKAVFSMNTSAAVLGLGYIMGIKYASIIMAGSLLSYVVLVPLFPTLVEWWPALAGLTPAEIRALAPQEIFAGHVRRIGVGGIFAAGVFSILRMSPIILRAVRQALGEVRRLAKGGGAEVDLRTERGLSMSVVLGGVAATALAILLYFRLSVLAGTPHASTLAVTAASMTLVMAFLFTAVSAWAIAMISITPVSGMTLTTLIVTAAALSALGLSGEGGMLQTLLIGGVVCTALSMAGSLVTQYKIAYWLGATPRRVELANLFGAIVASAATTAVILLMARVYGFTPGPAHPNALPAPQPNVMADVLRGAMGSSGVPWMLYAIGAACAIGAQLAGVSGLAFALGMYLPMELNSPLVLGALVAWAVGRSARGVAPLASARHDKGTLIASGFIAGGALVGVLIALMRYAQELFGWRLIVDLTALAGIGPWLTAWGNWLGLSAFLLLALWVFYSAWREEGEVPA